ncbi:collagen alpha-1(X) chain-like [Watersipora subatra]|uniref:collagen alpha-1(X) chain-like n=1 Tax=Watersipora subatra TaxID=2589382 RepID=UPI00355B8643
MTRYCLCLVVVLLVSGLRAERGIIHTQCQCTCPIYAQQLQDTINGKAEESRIDQFLPEDDPATTPITTQTLVTSTVSMGSGENDIYSYDNYNIDELFMDDKEDNTIVIPRPGGYPTSDAENAMKIKPEEARAPGPPVMGQKGEKGAMGFPGPAGLNGDNGLDGAVGAAGEPGQKGEQGQQGMPGLKGEQGKRGFAGTMGLQGYRGPPGPMGEPGRQGPRGNDGARGLRGEQGQPGRRGTPGKPGIKGEIGEPGIPGKDLRTDSTQVSFLARLLDHFGPSVETTHIIFSRIDLNLGDGYEPASGAFNVPADGVYVFHLEAMAMADHIAWLAIKVNGDPVAYAWANGYTSATEQMGTAMTIQQLRRGDIVNIIQKASSNPPNYLYAHYTLFSGYKIG